MGYYLEEPIVCNICLGTGATHEYNPKDNFTVRVEPKTCDQCEGSGLVTKEIIYKPYKPFGYNKEDI